MSALRRWLSRFRNAIAPNRANREAERELAAHLQLIEDDYRRRGLSAEDARLAARRAIGGIDPVRRVHEDARSFMWLDDLRRDTTYAVRTLARAPGFTVVALVTIALGIGSATAIFSVVDHVLLRSLPLPNADRLVRLYESNPADGRPKEGAAPANVADWRANSKSFELLTVTGWTSATMTGAAEPETLTGMLVGPEFFRLTGVTPALGRPFDADAYQSAANSQLGAVRNPGTKTAGDNATIIISHALWQRQFGGDPNVVGRAVALEGNPAVVVGVMPSDFRFDDTMSGRADYWLPLVESGRLMELRRFRQYPAIGRLNAGVTLPAAQAEMTAIAAGLAAAHPADNGGWTIRLEPLKDSLVTDTRLTLLILLGGVACVLLIAGANVAHLLLMRAAGRAREVAVRLAIGAGRSRLVRQWVTESTLLALLGGLAGFIVAWWAVPVLVAHTPINLPRLDRITVDGRIFALSTGLSLAIGLLCGLAPAFGSRRVSVASLRTSAPLGESGGQRWLRVSLVAAQIGLAIVLLVGAGLLARTLIAVRSVDLGFDPARVLTFGVNLRRAQYQTLDVYRAFSHDLVSRLQAVPGVEAAGVGSVPLLGGLTAGFTVEGRTEPMDVSMDAPTAGYFRALGIRLHAGRFFDDRDTSTGEPVAIVNVAFARAAWNTDAVVGRRLHVGTETRPWMAVVGVVDNVRVSSLETAAPPVAYLPYDQSTIGTFSNYVVRTTGDPREAVRLVRDALRGIDPSVPITRLATMDERVGKLVAPREFNLWLIGVFSAIALALAAVGVYGLISEAVASRTMEIGVRMALGAGRLRVLSLVARRMAIVTVIGTAIGLAAAVAVARSLGSMLFGVKPLDPVTLVLVPGVFFAAACLATLAPARRATKVDPIIALRGE